MIGIYYIATGSYKVYLDGFIKSLKNFRIGRDKEIILLTDEIIDTTRYTIPIKQHFIPDAPWPIVTLLKMWYINEHKGSYDEIYYFNANAQVKEDIVPCGDKMLLTFHSRRQTSLDGSFFMKIVDDNPQSCSYIGYHDYDYVQAGFFGGKAEIVYKMCEEVSKWVESDLKRCIIPKWHDESYLNKWATIHKDEYQIIRAWDSISLEHNDKFIPKK